MMRWSDGVLAVSASIKVAGEEGLLVIVFCLLRPPKKPAKSSHIPERVGLDSVGEVRGEGESMEGECLRLDSE